MKNCLILLSVVFVYVSYAYAQVHEDPCEGYRGPDRTECYYQFLLKRWRAGADGQVQAPVDSAVRQRVLRRLSSRSGGSFHSIERLKEIVNLGRYRGIGIFRSDSGLRYECIVGRVSPETYALRLDGIAIKMVTEYYNIDEDIKTICRGIWNIEVRDGLLVGIRGLPNDEVIVFLISNITFEVLSTYRYRVKRDQGE
jgi:hypothetical protein